MSGVVPGLEALRAAGALDALDVHFARTVCRLAGEEDPRVRLGAAVACRAPTRGHVCAELPRLCADPVLGSDGQPVEGAAWPALDGWLAALAASPLVGDGTGARPLVLDGAGRLYLERYWRYERRLAGALLARAGEAEEPAAPPGLDRLFPPRAGGEGPDLQRAAAEVALYRRLAVVSGGPGTGKTTTVVRILALLQEGARAAGCFPRRMALAAPTGKAAARMVEAVRAQKAGLDVDDAVREAIPEEASTIHRLLGTRRDRPTRFSHDAEDPLAADVVVVDEASMVDLALMCKLVDAIRPDASLVLLGDRDQLASVEAGAILGDVCRVGEEPAEGAPLAGCLVHLTESWRFGADSGIGALARAINAGDGDAAVEVLRAGAPDVRLVPAPEDADPAVVRNEVVAGWGPLCRATDPAEALAALEGCRVLCAHRRGPMGVEPVNAAVEGWLADEGLIRPEGRWYAHRPVLVTQNDYGVRLFNGDAGVVLPDETGELRVWFPGEAGGPPRALHPARLPPHASLWAMTVHRSQGSEFDRVVVLLPPQVSRILTRELLYTAVTRAKRQVTVVGSEEVIGGAVDRRVQRASGLRELLWG